MADIVLAEHHGQTWLVSGEKFIDDLLANTLPGYVTIELVVCESESDFADVRSRALLAQVAPAEPWMIHPAIARRVRRGLSGQDSSGHRVAFSPWSAALDDEADAAIAAASRAAAGGLARILLTSYIAAGSPPPLADLASLRSSLIEAELIRFGIEPSRIMRARAESDAGAPADHIDITIAPD